MKKIFLAFISLAVVFSCNKLDSISEIEDDFSSISSSEEDLDRAKFDSLIKVKFNNTYKGLYKENELIARKDPQNPDKIFARLIGEAKKSIDVCIFDIEEEIAYKALINAHNRGVKVRIVTDSDNLNDKERPSQPRKAIEEMQKAGIKIVPDNKTSLMHHKFAVIDESIVLTGSLNLTVNSLFRDNNNAIRIVSKELAQSYKYEFERMFEQNLFNSSGRVIPYPKVNVGGADISVYFSPRGGTRDAVLEELKKAKKSIYFMTFSLTDKDTVNLLLDKNKNGVHVEGIFDGCMISKYSAYLTLIKSKLPVYIDGNQALLHNKVFIIDNSTIITGSYNFSKNAEENNNENTLIIKSARLSKDYYEEFKKLKHASKVNTNLPPYDNRTCGAKDNGNDDTTNLVSK
ncbi:MAG: phospholipase D-like domain-containing protein [Candidatus Sericytochromatia bacterium]